MVDINYVIRGYVYKPAPGEIHGELPLPEFLFADWTQKVADARENALDQDILKNPLTLHEFYWFNLNLDRLSLRFVHTERRKVQISQVTYQDKRLISCPESVYCFADEYDDWYAKHGQNTAPLEFCMVY